jgi:hypothetical protein
MRQRYELAPLVCLLTLLATNLAHAEQVFKSIDAQGQVTYSAYPPDDAVHTEIISITYENQSGNYKVDTESLVQYRQVADKLETDRKQRENKRETLKKQLQEELEEAQLAYPPEPVIYYYPVYIHKHHHHHKKPRKHRRRYEQHQPQPRHQPSKLRVLPVPEPVQYIAKAR